MNTRIDLPLVLRATNYCDVNNPKHLDVRITNLCDNACSFCIAAEGMKHARKFDLDAMLASIRSVKPESISIIGGEPLLFLEKLSTFMDQVVSEQSTIKSFFITTALPLTVARQPELFRDVFNKTEVLNVSLNHYRNDDNSRVLKAKSNWDRFEWLKEFLKDEDDARKIRVHLNLSRGGIDTVGELNAALFTLREMGVKHLKLNELMNAPEDYVSFEDITGIKLDSPYAHGCSTIIDYFPGIEINLKRSCWVVESSRAATKMDLLKALAKSDEPSNDLPRVLYEDGELATRWLD